MANGKIIIDVELNDDGVLSGLKNIESMAGGSQGKKNGGLIGNMFGGIKNMVGAGLALKGVQVAWNSLKSGVTDGISRYDTMQRFPKMMQQIGFTSGEADQAIQNLSNGIQGLPTALDSVTGTAQQIALMTGDLTGAVDTTLALNNAFLASGSSSADASRGLVQFQQMMARGEPDLQSWRTLMETMPVALQMLGKELGYSGENLYELYDAMQDGELTFEDFTKGLIDLNEKQGGLAEMALENSKGIATSWQNVSTAIARGWADILDATDRGLAKLGMGSIADQINKLKDVVNTGFSAVVSGIDWVARQAVKLGPVFSEIGRQVTGFLEPLKDSAGRFFKPVIDGFGEIGKAVTQFGYRMNGVLRAIGEGNWRSAWNIFRDASLQTFERVGTAFSNMWTGMQKNIKAIDWRLTFQNISGSVQDVVSSINNWLTTAVPKVYDFIVDVLIDPNSELNQGARDFHAQVMGLLDSAWEWAVDKVVNVLINPEAEINNGEFHDAVMGEIDKAWAELKSIIASDYRELEVQIQLTWNELAGKVAEWVSGVKASILSGWAEIQGYSEALGAEGIQQEVVMDMIILEGEGWSPSEIQAYIDEKHGKGEYETHVHLVPQLEAGEPEPSVQDAVESVVGNETLTVEQEVEAKINVYAGQGFKPARIQELIDKEFGAGTYESVVTAEVLVEILEKLQYSEGRIQQLIDAEFGAGTYESLVNVQVETEEEVMESHTLEPLIQGHIAGQIIEPIEKEVIVNPKISIGHGGSDSLAGEGAQPGSLAGGGMFAGLIEQVNQGMVQVQEAVTQSMAQVNQTITMQTQQWGLTMTTGFTQIGLAVGLGMTTMTLAITLGMTMATLAVTTGMMSMQLAMTTGVMAMTLAVSTGMMGITLAISTGMIASTLAVTTGMTGMTHAVTTGMIGMTIAVTTGMTGMSLAVTTGMTAMESSVSTGMTSMSQAVDSGTNAMSNSFDSAMSSMESTTSSSMSAMSQAVESGTSNMKSSFEQAMSAIQASAERGFQGVLNAIQNGMNSSVSAVSSAMSSITASMQSGASSAYSAGLNIGQGLANGINASAGSAIASARSLANSVNSILNSVFRFGSPSKVTTQYGEWIGQGLSRGMEHTYGLVNRVSNKLGGYALPTVDPNRAIGLSGYGSSGSANYQSEVNIHIDKFINNRKEDLPQLVEELRYYENVKLQGGL